MGLRKFGLMTGLQYIVPLAILFTCIILRWQNVPVIDQLRLTVFDLYQQIAPRAYEDVGVRIVDVDFDALAVGLSVNVDFASWSEEITLPVFRLPPAMDDDAS